MATSREARKTRTPIQDGFRSKLRVNGKDPAYEYYIVTDKDGRVDDFVGQGWQVVTDDKITIGDKRIGTPTEVGKVRTVSVGGGDVGVLMKIQKEDWAEIQAIKSQRAKDAVSQTIQDSKDASDYGKVKFD